MTIKLETVIVKKLEKKTPAKITRKHEEFFVRMSTCRQTTFRWPRAYRGEAFEIEPLGRTRNTRTYGADSDFESQNNPPKGPSPKLPVGKEIPVIPTRFPRF